MFPRVYSVGPLSLLLNQVSDDELKMLGSNLWKEDLVCVEWLDSREPNSVLYVNFGSITVMTQKQLSEFAWGLADSGQNFLWIIRPDLVTGDLAILPDEFYRSGFISRLVSSGACSEPPINWRIFNTQWLELHS